MKSVCQQEGGFPSTEDCLVIHVFRHSLFISMGFITLITVIDINDKVVDGAVAHTIIVSLYSLYIQQNKP